MHGLLLYLVVWLDMAWLPNYDIDSDVLTMRSPSGEVITGHPISGSSLPRAISTVVKTCVNAVSPPAPTVERILDKFVKTTIAHDVDFSADIVGKFFAMLRTFEEYYDLLCSNHWSSHLLSRVFIISSVQCRA